MRHYSAAFKSKIVRRLTGPDAQSAGSLAKELGIAQPTLSRWLREASEDRVSDMKKKRRPRDWPAQEKLAAVTEASQLCDEELGAFLRRKGLHQAQLNEWRKAMLTALESPPTRKPKTSPEARRLRELEKELKRKDKALAETAALLVLKKKAQAIWGDEDDDTEPRSER